MGGWAVKWLQITGLCIMPCHNFKIGFKTQSLKEKSKKTDEVVELILHRFETS